MVSQEIGKVATGRVHRINVSQGGVPKLSVTDGVVNGEGLVGDEQANRKFHGGPDRALCLFSLEKITALQAEGHPIQPGTTGENITTQGLDWSQLAPGTALQLGDDAVIEITAYTTPCKAISGSFSDGRFVRISEKVHPGDSRLYARVLRGGRICVGDSIRVCDSSDFHADGPLTPDDLSTPYAG